MDGNVRAQDWVSRLAKSPDEMSPAEQVVWLFGEYTKLLQKYEALAGSVLPQRKLALFEKQQAEYREMLSGLVSEVQREVYSEQLLLEKRILMRERLEYIGRRRRAGATHAQIAKELGVSRPSITQWINHRWRGRDQRRPLMPLKA